MWHLHVAGQNFEKVLSTLNKNLADGWLFVCVKLAGVGWMFVSMLEGREPSLKTAKVQQKAYFWACRPRPFL